MGYLAQPSVGQLLQRPLSRLGLTAPAVEAVSAGLALLLATVFSMVFGELLPQFLGISAPLRTARSWSRARARVRGGRQAADHRAQRVGQPGAAAFGITPQEELSGARTPQELASLVRRSAEAGTLDEGTARLVTRSLDFGEQTAADVMSPRVRCTAIERRHRRATCCGWRGAPATPASR